jgi:hypothetical protein
MKGIWIEGAYRQDNPEFPEGKFRTSFHRYGSVKWHSYKKKSCGIWENVYY